jgi:hypothetical protein
MKIRFRADIAVAWPKDEHLNQHAHSLAAMRTPLASTLQGRQLPEIFSFTLQRMSTNRCITKKHRR